MDRQVPLEVWSHSFSESCLKKNDLRNLTRTCVRFRAAARPLLWRVFEIEAPPRPTTQIADDIEDMEAKQETTARQIDSWAEQLLTFSTRVLGARPGEGAPKDLVRAIIFKGNSELLDLYNYYDSSEDDDNTSESSRDPKGLSSEQLLRASYLRLLKCFDAVLAHFPNVATLKFTDVPITPRLLSQLSSMLCIHQLILEQCTVELAASNQPLPSLQTLKLARCSLNTVDNSGKYAPHPLPPTRLFEAQVIRRLEGINLSHHSDQFLSELQNPLPFLTHLALQVSNDKLLVFIRILEHIPLLQSLHISHERDGWHHPREKFEPHNWDVISLQRSALPHLCRFAGTPEALSVFIPGRPVEEIDVVMDTKRSPEEEEDIVKILFSDISQSLQPIHSLRFKSVRARTSIFDLIALNCPELRTLGLDLRVKAKDYRNGAYFDQF
ncbi:hypothetical protein HGRIS_001685 [Hohenbuehelia grisea]|uniref:F-box domain-containing protein n=1 Tax=Hohenbuehelia grisea TaxID=104357 RepID=A0ABR3JI57_9AGAR